MDSNGGVLVDYVINLHVETHPTEAVAVAWMSGPSGAMEAKGRAAIGRQDSEHCIAGDLAVARALRKIEAQVMETVHERIDRFTAAEYPA